MHLKRYFYKTDQRGFIEYFFVLIHTGIFQKELTMKKLVLLFSCYLLSSMALANLPYYPITFPRDEAAHYDNIPYSYDRLIEWWYFNGKATTDDGRNIGYDIAMFYPAKKVFGYVVTKPIIHIQVADIDKQQGYGVQTEYAVDDGNVSTSKLDITVDNDYSLKESQENGKTVYLLQATGSNKTTTIKLNLKYEPLTEPLLINQTGLMPIPDNTNSYYYSIPRFKTTGTIQVNNTTYQINTTPGDSWMDHQWGDFNPEKFGWEWFSVRLTNGLIANIFLDVDYQHNEKVVGGLANIILPSGDLKFIPYTDFQVSRDNYWLDPALGIRYPLTFTFNFPQLNLQLQNVAAFADQERNGYWEGACNVSGTYNQDAVTGYSYTEIVYQSPATKKFAHQLLIE